jgi:hypothetical protein
MPPAQEGARLLEEDALTAFYVAPPSYEELARQRFINDFKRNEDDTDRSWTQLLRWRNIILITLVHVVGLCNIVFGLAEIKLSSLIMSKFRKF